MSETRFEDIYPDRSGAVCAVAGCSNQPRGNAKMKADILGSVHDVSFPVCAEHWTDWPTHRVELKIVQHPRGTK